MDEEKKFEPLPPDNVKSFLQKVKEQLNTLSRKVINLGARNKVSLTSLQANVFLAISFIAFLIVVVFLFQTLFQTNRNRNLLEKLALLETLGEELDYSGIGAEELFVDELKVIEKLG